MPASTSSSNGGYSGSSSDNEDKPSLVDNILQYVKPRKCFTSHRASWFCDCMILEYTAYRATQALIAEGCDRLMIDLPDDVPKIPEGADLPLQLTDGEREERSINYS